MKALAMIITLILGKITIASACEGIKDQALVDLVSASDRLEKFIGSDEDFAQIHSTYTQKMQKKNEWHENGSDGPFRGTRSFRKYYSKYF